MLTTPADVGSFSICIPVMNRDILIIVCRLGKRNNNMNNDDDHDSNVGDHYTWSTKQPQGRGCKTWDALDSWALGDTQICCKPDKNKSEED